MRTYKICLAIGLFALSSGAALQSAFAQSIVTVSNNPSTLSGDNINAQDIANNLVFTSITISASNEIQYFPSLNLGTSIFGIPAYDLTSSAPTVSILGDLTVSNLGNFLFTAPQINLAGSFYDLSSALIAESRLASFGTATNVNVLSNSASLQQAVYLTGASLGQSTVTAAFGTANSLAFDYDTSMILSGGLLSGAVAMNNAAARLELHGTNFQIDTGSGFVALGSGSIGASSGQLTGFLSSGDHFSVSFNQSQSGQISVVSAIPEPETYAMLLAGLGLLGFEARRRRKL